MEGKERTRHRRLTGRGYVSECVDCLLDDARESVHRRGEAHVPLVQLVQGLEQLGVDVAGDVEVWIRLLIRIWVLMWMCGCRCVYI